MGYHADVDKELCVSAGLCLTAAPSVFSPDDDGVSQASPDASGSIPLHQLVQIARECPSSAISVFLDGKRVGLD